MMEIPAGTQGCSAEGLLLALILALCLPQGSQAALRIQKIPEQPQKNQDLLLSLHGVPDVIQDYMWYLGEETSGGTRLFSYIPGVPRPQRDGSAMGQRDVVGFPNGSMLLRGIQPSDSGTYQVAVTINPAWTMKTKTEVRVSDQGEDPAPAHLSVNAAVLAAAIIGPLAVGCLLIGGFAYFLVTRGWKGPSPRTPTEKPVPSPTPGTGDSNIYEVMPSPVLLVSPVSDTGPVNPAMTTPPPEPQQPQPENQHYQDLLNPDPAPYCQLVPTS